MKDLGELFFEYGLQRGFYKREEMDLLEKRAVNEHHLQRRENTPEAVDEYLPTLYKALTAALKQFSTQKSTEPSLPRSSAKQIGKCR